MLSLPAVVPRVFAALALLLGLAAPLQAQQVPKTAGRGLRGQYFEGQNFETLIVTRLDPTIDFDWTYGPTSPDKSTQRFLSPAPGVPAEGFSVRWMGHLYIPVSGRYTFRILNDDGMRVWLGGKKILDAWRDQVATETATEIELVGGRYYPLRAEYYQVQWDTRARLTWQLPGSAAEPQPIPADNLYAALPPSAKPIPNAAVRPRRVAAPAPVVPSVAPAAPIARAAPAPARRTAPVPRRPAPTPPVAPPAAALPGPATAPDTLPDLATLRKGAAVTLSNLYFTQSTATLLPTSRPLLNQLARMLRAQPALRLEIAGHTDNVGEPALNLRLSEQRARTVRRYLVQQGIDSVRLTAVGYGGTRPVADNRDPQQRPRNRRVEVVVQ
ncbi:Outer membrane protein OmpA [Hymenobacter daecheongensis DSM 21074]|uniref:Outer membrane protein OmpA n=1 Tax=Hymenobacter daecheongensis DSM 21074 TaxID=1121955 RepID=A0A1M6AMN7_9BACT|nr:PA14 domain-containing protein [Hymenobacter daecheongensis]SHI37746.1 Outer membrane protein OmpA [Hymenobacter daecheongensis DSM 21074]